MRSSSTSLLSLRVGRHLGKGVSLAVEVFNVLDRADSDIAYYYASRLPGEPAEGVEDIHFHPMEPRSWRLSMEWKF